MFKRGSAEFPFVAQAPLPHKSVRACVIESARFHPRECRLLTLPAPSLYTLHRSSYFSLQPPHACTLFSLFSPGFLRSFFPSFFLAYFSPSSQFSTVRNQSLEMKGHDGNAHEPERAAFFTIPPLLPSLSSDHGDPRGAAAAAQIRSS